MVYTLTIDNYDEVLTKEVINELYEIACDNCFGEDLFVNEEGDITLCLNNIDDYPDLSMPMLTRLWLVYLNNEHFSELSYSDFMKAFAYAYFNCLAEEVTSSMYEEVDSLCDTIRNGFYSEIEEYDFYRDWVSIRTYHDYKGSIWVLTYKDTPEGIDFSSINFEDTKKKEYKIDYTYTSKTENTDDINNCVVL